MVSIAFYTFLLQAVLFPVFILFLVYFSMRLMFARGIRKKTNTNTAKAKKEEIKIPVLKPLTCAQCGGAVSLRNNHDQCPYCAAPVHLPPEYRETGRLRNDLALRLQKAQRYLRRSRFLTSPWLRWIIRLLYIWIPVAMVICFVHESIFVEKATRLLGSENLVEKFIALGLCTTLVWIILLMIMAGSISRKANKLLPVVQPVDLGKAEDLSCGTCGNRLHFNKGSLVELCDYCGVETYRAKIAWQTRNLVNESRKKASFSLVEAMETYRAAVEDIWSGPAVIIFIFLVLPFFMIVLPVMIWEFIKAHLLMVLLSLVALIVLLVLFSRDGKKKAEKNA